MDCVIKSVDQPPEAPALALPARATIARRLDGGDRVDYWLAKLEKSLSWRVGDTLRRIDYIVISPRFEGILDGHGIHGTPIDIAYVIDDSLLLDSAIDFAKCWCGAVGVASGL